MGNILHLCCFPAALAVVTWDLSLSALKDFGQGTVFVREQCKEEIGDMIRSANEIPKHTHVCTSTHRPVHTCMHNPSDIAR